jgi:hypothetical protein
MSWWHQQGWCGSTRRWHMSLIFGIFRLSWHNTDLTRGLYRHWRRSPYTDMAQWWSNMWHYRWQVAVTWRWPSDWLYNMTEWCGTRWQASSLTRVVWCWLGRCVGKLTWQSTGNLNLCTVANLEVTCGPIMGAMWHPKFGQCWLGQMFVVLCRAQTPDLPVE